MLASRKHFVGLLIMSPIWLVFTIGLIYVSIINWELFTYLAGWISEGRIMIYLIPYFLGWLMFFIMSLFLFVDNIHKSFIDKEYSLGKRIFGVNW